MKVQKYLTATMVMLCALIAACGTTSTTNQLAENVWQHYAITGTPFLIAFPEQPSIQELHSNLFFVESGPYEQDKPTPENYFYFFLQRLPTVHSHEEYLRELCFSSYGSGGIAPHTVSGDALPLRYSIVSSWEASGITITEIETSCGFYFPSHIIEHDRIIYQIAHQDLGSGSNDTLFQQAMNSLTIQQ